MVIISWTLIYNYLHYLLLHLCCCCYKVSVVVASGLHQVHVDPVNLQGTPNSTLYLICGHRKSPTMSETECRTCLAPTSILHANSGNSRRLDKGSRSGVHIDSLEHQCYIAGYCRGVKVATDNYLSILLFDGVLELQCIYFLH